jgi:DNA-binding SARP family transcriptional activator/TolB-like protein
VLSISLVGAVSAWGRGKSAELGLRKAVAALGYLCLQDRMTTTRERLAYLLWSDSDEQKARASLRQTLSALRRAFSSVGFNGLTTDKLNVHLQAQRSEIDLLRVLDAAEQMRVDPLLLTTARLPERILEGLEDVDAEFRGWLLPVRQSIHNRLERSLGAGLNATSTSDAEKLNIATALLSLDPTNEEACRYVVASHGRRGDIASAKRAYGELAEVLSKDHGVKPSTKTQRVFDQVTRGEGNKESALVELKPYRQLTAVEKVVDIPAAEPVVDQPQRGAVQGTIVVRLDRFEANGVPSKRSYLVSGFRHELAACLVRFREWMVLDDPAASTAPPLLANAIEYRLTGTAYQTGRKMNLVLTLLDVARSAYIWSESFELRLDNWFNVQQQLISRLASTLNVYLSAERLKRALAEPEVAPTTYDTWLRSQAYLATFRTDDWRKGYALLREATRVGPTFSPLFSGLAQMGNMESVVFPGVLMTSSRVEQNLVLAKRAVQLDALDSRAHLCLSWTHAVRLDFKAAMPHMRHAMELNNNDPWTTLSAGVLWAYAGETDRARALMAEATTKALTPTQKEWAYCGHIRFLSGDYDGAIDAFNKVGGFPKTIAAWKAAAMALLGQTTEAISVGREFLNATRVNWHGKQPATDEAIAQWLMQVHPVGAHEHRHRLCEGLRKASIPVEGTALK